MSSATKGAMTPLAARGAGAPQPGQRLETITSAVSLVERTEIERLVPARSVMAEPSWLDRYPPGIVDATEEWLFWQGRKILVRRFSCPQPVTVVVDDQYSAGDEAWIVVNELVRSRSARHRVRRRLPRSSPSRGAAWNPRVRLSARGRSS